MNTHLSRMSRVVSARSEALRCRAPGRVAGLAVALLLGLAAAPAARAADTTKVYAWRSADGTVTYAQVPPPPGTPGVTSEEIDTRSFTPAQTAAVKAQLAGIDAAELADAQRFRRQLSAADRAVAEAVRALGRAEQAFRQGRAPLPGERVGNAGGGSRLRPSYFERQKQLELAVEQARTRLNDAYRARDGIKP